MGRKTFVVVAEFICGKSKGSKAMYKYRKFKITDEAFGMKFLQ